MASNYCRNEQLSVPNRGGWWVEILGHLDGVNAWLRKESYENKTLWKQKLRTRGGAVQLTIITNYGSDNGYGPGSGGGGYGNANGNAVGLGGGVGWGGVGGDGHFGGGFRWRGNGGGMARVMVAA
ncbi:uncharacterized protein LOC7462853 [Populus trichocarpa]|uniref:uncharacterized protein LOC7462853 n=1 Tax=Populus trichocarpa TaxID=3694 RepID=UPI002279A66F|nr:uncharacterized protein LOC7462853 [Populus trichocarpa]